MRTAKSEEIMRKTYRRSRRVAGCALFVLGLTAGPAAAQTAEVTGRVRDASQGVVPGASVVAMNEDTGIPRETKTDENGLYVLTFVPTGRYRLTVTLSGFQTVTRSD